MYQLYDITLNGINYSNFLELIEILSIKVYPKDIPDISLKRIILENVLLLANRRIPIISLYDLDDSKVYKYLNDVLGKGLHDIFYYYIDLATQIRKTEISNEKMKMKEKIRMQFGCVDPDNGNNIYYECMYN